MKSPTVPTSKDYYSAGVELLEKRAFEEALEAFRGVSNVDPKYAEAQFQIARIVMLANRAWQAIEPLKTAIGVKPEASLLWQAYAEAIALGGTLEDEKTFKSDLKSSKIAKDLKIALQDRFAAQRKSSRPALGGMSQKQVKQLLGSLARNDFAKTERIAANALKHFPRSALAANILAVVCSATKRPTEAKKAYEHAIKIDPNYAEAYDNLGRLLLGAGKRDEAANCLKRAVTLAPGMVSALVSFGVELNKTREYRSAQILLERAVAEKPEDALANLELGNIYVKLNLPEQAEAQFEKARKLADDKISADHRISLAQMKARNGKDEEAMAEYERILKDYPDLASALGGKASLLQTLGRFEEARELFGLAARQDPTNGENYRMFVASQKIESDDPLIDEMKTIYEGELTELSRMNLAFAISKALEDVKRDEEVFEYLNVANGLMHKSYPYQIKQRYSEISVFKEAYGKFDFASSQSSKTSSAAPIFVTGMPRSGTTLVEQIIASHSTMTSAGELGRASALARDLIVRGKTLRELREVSEQEFAQVETEYAAYLSERLPNASRITDKAITTYMHIGPLKLAMPNAKFIVVRRDPRDNLFSIYKNKFPDGTHGYAYDMEDLARYYTTFVEMIDFWRERIPDWFYEVQYEKLVANPGEESRKLIAACGLEWEDACLNFHQNKNKVQTLSLYQVRQPISKASVKGWKRFEKELEPMLKILREDGHVTD